MKRFFCWVLLILLMFTLTGCGSSYRSSSSSRSNSSYGSSGSSAYQEAYKWVSDNTFTGSDGKLYWK